MGEQPQDSIIPDSVGLDDDQPFAMPTKEDLLAMLDTMEISDEDKEQLRDALVNNKPMPMSMLSPEKSMFSSQFFVLMCLLLLVASIFGKLYSTYN